MKNLLNYLDDYFDENIEENMSYHTSKKKNKLMITEEKISHKHKEDNLLEQNRKRNK